MPFQSAVSIIVVLQGSFFSQHVRMSVYPQSHLPSSCFFPEPLCLWLILFRETGTASLPRRLVDMFGHDVIRSEFSWCLLVIRQWFSLLISPFSHLAGLLEEFRKSLASAVTVNGFYHYVHSISSVIQSSAGQTWSSWAFRSGMCVGIDVHHCGWAVFSSTVLRSWHPAG